MNMNTFVASGTSALLAAGLLVVSSPASPAAAACDPDMTANVSVFLGGPYNTATDLMSDALRTGFNAGNPVLPTTEPYSALGYPLRGGEGNTLALGDTSVAGPASAPVDWIVIELRSAIDPTVIIATDIRVVSRDGSVDAPIFEVNPGSYYVAVRHRNHLGVMTAAPIVFDGVTPPTIDFTDPATPLFVRTDIPLFDYTGVQARLIEPGVVALWDGDANGNKQAKFQGLTRDPQQIFVDVIGHPNSMGNPLFDEAYGYYGGDVNMDGKATQVVGPTGDLTLIRASTDRFPLNTVPAADFDFMYEQVPAASTLGDPNDPVYSCQFSTGGTELAETGTTVQPALLAGLALLLLGGASIVVATRRRQIS